MQKLCSPYHSPFHTDFFFQCHSEKNFEIFLDGSEMKFEEFTNKKYSCGVPFENLNLFVVTGGNLTW